MTPRVVQTPRSPAIQRRPEDPDASGRAEAIATCRCGGTPLPLRINAMYAAVVSPSAAFAAQHDGASPSVFALAFVMVAVREESAAVYAGLFEVGLGLSGATTDGRTDLDRPAFDLLFRYNQTQKVRLLRAVLARGPAASGVN